MLTKLAVDFQTDGSYDSLDQRVYTLTHSDETGQRILFIGDRIDKDRINKLRDEVEGRWVKEQGEYKLQVACNLYSEYSELTIQERYEKFKFHIFRAIAGIVNGDRGFIEKNNCSNCRVTVHYIGKSEDIKEDQSVVREYLK